MFVTALSSKQGYTADPSNPNPNDVSPATFTVEFDEPIRIKNADIELVSCKVSKQNDIVVSPNSNTMSVRMGTDAVAEAYRVTVAAGTYTPDAFAQAVAASLDVAMPCNTYRGWSAIILPTGELQLRYTLQVPAALQEDTFANLVKTNESNAIVKELGVNYQGWSDAFPAEPGFVQTTVAPAYLESITSPYEVPNEDFITCAGIDVGELPGSSSGPDQIQRTGFSKFGIWETGKGGVFETIITPLRCVTKSSFSVGYNGFSGSTAKPTYWTWEFGENTSSAGDPINSGNLKFGSLFSTEEVLNDTRPIQYPLESPQPLSSKRAQINGCLAFVVPFEDRRGAPYNSAKTLIFPYSQSRSVATQADVTRIVEYDATWTGQISFNGDQDNVPNQYTMQVSPTQQEPAFSVVQPASFGVREQVFARLSIKPLIQGLPQQTASLDADYTKITLTNILFQPAAWTTSALKYKAGSVGFMNTRINPSIRNLLNSADNTQGRRAMDNTYIMPRYKILDVSTDGKPLTVVLLDSGEHINVFDAANVAGTALYLNDPNTFEALDPALTASQQLAVFWQVRPVAASIGADVIVDEPVVAPRMPSTNIGLMRDNIYEACLANTQTPERFEFQKDLQIELHSVMQKPDGSTYGTNGSVELIAKQLQPPIDVMDDYYTIPGRDDSNTLLKGVVHEWSSLGGTPALVDWSSWDGPGSSTSAVKLSITQRDTYNPVLVAAYTNNYGVTPFSSPPSIIAQFGTLRPGFSEMNCYRKSRFFPLHPIAALLPGSISEAAQHKLRAVGTEYEEANYEKNLSTMTRSAQSPAINLALGASPPNGEKPLIMLKTTSLSPTQIGNAVPPAGGTTADIVLPADYDPHDGANCHVANLPSVAYGIIANAATAITMPVGNPISLSPFLPSFAVEIQNLPCAGYLGKSFDNGLVSERRGSGQRLPIVGIVPAKEFPTTTNPISRYWYKTEYYQPVQVRLPSPQFLYDLQINLRSILTGQLLKDLLHTTEAVFRIYPLPD